MDAWIIASNKLYLKLLYWKRGDLNFEFYDKTAQTNVITDKRAILNRSIETIWIMLVFTSTYKHQSRRSILTNF